MKKLLLLLLVASQCDAQSITTEILEQKKWVLHSNLNLPAAKFNLASKSATDDAIGYLELFSSYGVGLSLNYGTVTFVRDIDRDKILHNETKFTNTFGFQAGLLFSSKLNENNPTNLNNLSFYSGINILDLQIGMGYDLGSKIERASGWFLSLSYAIPVNTIPRKASFIFDKNKARYKYKKNDIAMAYN